MGPRQGSKCVRAASAARESESESQLTTSHAWLAVAGRRRRRASAARYLTLDAALAIRDSGIAEIVSVPSHEAGQQSASGRDACCKIEALINEGYRRKDKTNDVLALRLWLLNDDQTK